MYSISCTQRKELTETTGQTTEIVYNMGAHLGSQMHLEILGDSNGTTIAHYRGRTIRIS